MSVTPKGGGKGGHAITATEAESKSLKRRVLDGLVPVLRRIPLARRIVPSNSGECTNATPTSAPTDDIADHREGGSVSGLPDRRRPFTYPTRDRPERNPVDLVGETRQDTLTITHPDNPDATITSDVWEDVRQ
jgi:hypothetical protein